MPHRYIAPDSEYLPTEEEIEAHKALFRQQHLDAKLKQNFKPDKKRLAKCWQPIPLDAEVLEVIRSWPMDGPPQGGCV